MRIDVLLLLILIALLILHAQRNRPRNRLALPMGAHLVDQSISVQITNLFFGGAR